MSRKVLGRLSAGVALLAGLAVASAAQDPVSRLAQDQLTGRAGQLAPAAARTDVSVRALVGQHSAQAASASLPTATPGDGGPAAVRSSAPAAAALPPPTAVPSEIQRRAIGSASFDPGAPELPQTRPAK
jgi:hypothetical protein